jgi:hypothetical protein
LSYNITDGKVNKGTSTYGSDFVMTIKVGKLYKGTSTYSCDVLTTLRDVKVWLIALFSG